MRPAIPYPRQGTESYPEIDIISFLETKKNFTFLHKLGGGIFRDTLFGIEAINKDELAKSTRQVECGCLQ